jgi:hypothetical protein
MTRQELTDFLAERERASQENALDRWRREVREREAEHARERAQSREQRRLDTAPVDWSAEIERAVETAIEGEREHTIVLLAELLAHIERESAKKLREERRGLADETRQLRIELCELQTVVAELRAALAHERGKPLDLPSPLAARRVN